MSILYFAVSRKALWPIALQSMSMHRASCSIAWCSGLAAPACGIGGMRPSGAVMALSDPCQLPVSGLGPSFAATIHHRSGLEERLLAEGTYKSGASTEIRQKHTSPSDLSSMSMDSLHTLTKAHLNVALGFQARHASGGSWCLRWSGLVTPRFCHACFETSTGQAAL